MDSKLENKDYFEYLIKETDYTISQHLIKEHGFTKIPTRVFREDDLEWDYFTCYKRIHIAHYLFYSDLHKHFTIRYKFNKRIGRAGGGYETYESVMIPRVIYKPEDADLLITFFAGDSTISYL